LRAAVHDLKGPSGRLRVLAQLVDRTGSADPETATLLRHISDSARAMDGVIDALGKYSELCLQPLRKERIDLSIPLLAVIEARHRAIKAGEAEITFDSLPVVPADRARMAWLFGELVGNAIRFRSAAAPRIHIAATRAGPGEWVLAVTDNGLGIEASLLERVFRPFKRAGREGGAGLGLTICRQIVQLHGGRMWAEPRSDGAEIRFVLHE
jgi:light-regulated signal transduction histidine kinase (bacteriophytochrome)